MTASHCCLLYLLMKAVIVNASLLECRRRIGKLRLTYQRQLRLVPCVAQVARRGRNCRTRRGRSQIFKEAHPKPGQGGRARTHERRQNSKKSRRCATRAALPAQVRNYETNLCRSTCTTLHTGSHSMRHIGANRRGTYLVRWPTLSVSKNRPTAPFRPACTLASDHGSQGVAFVDAFSGKLHRRKNDGLGR